MGRVWSAGGFASPFDYAMTPGGGQSGTWTSTFANNLTQYVNISATWSAMSSSNTITLKSLDVVGWN
jgi:Uma2 family endonuclease